MYGVANPNGRGPVITPGPVLWIAMILAVSTPAVAQVPSPATIITSPADQPTPFVIGGLRLAPERLSVATAPVRRRGVVLSGVAEHARTARLSRPMRIQFPVFSEQAPAGAVLHMTEFVSDGPDGDAIFRTWCGDLGRKTIFGGASPSICFLEGDPLRRAWISETARPWLSTSSFVHGSIPGRADHFEIEPSADDLIGPMDVRLEVQRITRTNVTLRLMARRDGQDVTVMTLIRPIDNGSATVPLWTHMLALAVSGDSVTPSLTPDGDGAGPAGLFRATMP